MANDIDMDSPLKKFIQNQLRNVAHVKKGPRFANAQERYVLDKLQKAEDDWTPSLFRPAFVEWCGFEDPYLRENDYPPNHFLKHIEEYIPELDRTPRGATNPPRHEVASTSQAPTSLHVPLSEAVKRVTPAEMVATWNRIVTMKPFSGANPDGVFDPDFTASTWEKVCETAKAISEFKGKDASWLTLRWCLRSDPAKGQNWRRVAEGEFDFMTTGAMEKPMTRGQKDAKLASDFIAELKAKSALKKAQEKTDAVDR